MKTCLGWRHGNLLNCMLISSLSTRNGAWKPMRIIVFLELSSWNFTPFMMCGLNKNFVFQLVSGEYGAGQGIVDGAVLPDCVPVNLVALFILPCLVHVGHAPREEVIAIARKLQIPEEARHLLLRANLVPILDSFLYHEVEEQGFFFKSAYCSQRNRTSFSVSASTSRRKNARLWRDSWRSTRV